jgi:hypothetical protein
MRTRLWLAWDYWTRLWPEKVLTGIVWRLPRKIVYWSVVRAACAVEPNEYPGDVTAERMLKALDA